jgi:GNAT superfamily N-acetyltransferase
MRESLQMRQAVLSDAPAIRALTHDAYAKWVPVIGREPVPMTVDYVKVVQEHRIDLVYLDDALVALIETVPKADHLLIESVAVLPSFQGRGLGRNGARRADRRVARTWGDQALRERALRRERAALPSSRLAG